MVVRLLGRVAFCFPIVEVDLDMKMCRYYPDKRCYRSSCTHLDSFGNVVKCDRLKHSKKSCFSRKKVVSP